jgi:hypothetical protein
VTEIESLEHSHGSGGNPGGFMPQAIIEERSDPLDFSGSDDVVPGNGGSGNLLRLFRELVKVAGFVIEAGKESEEAQDPKLLDAILRLRELFRTSVSGHVRRNVPFSRRRSSVRPVCCQAFRVHEQDSG